MKIFLKITRSRKWQIFILGQSPTVSISPAKKKITLKITEIITSTDF